MAARIGAQDMQTGTMRALGWLALLSASAPQFWMLADATFHSAAWVLLPGTLPGWPLIGLLATRATRHRTAIILWLLALIVAAAFSYVPTIVFLDRHDPSLPGGLVGVLFAALPLELLMSVIAGLVALVIYLRGRDPGRDAPAAMQEEQG